MDERGSETAIFLFWSDYRDPLKPQARITATNEYLAIDLAIDGRRLRPRLGRERCPIPNPGRSIGDPYIIIERGKSDED